MSDDEMYLLHPSGKIGKGEFCESCARFNSRNVVTHALVIRDEKVLMVRRDIEPMKGYWALPGGYLDWNETTEECAERELREEAKMRGKVKGLIGVYSDPQRDSDGRENVGLVYLIEPLSEASPGDEVSEVEWFELGGLPEKMAFDHKHIVEDYRKYVEKVKV